MDERSEPSERTANELSEHLTFAEAAERLNVSADAVRMRVNRGKLASIRVNDRTFVLWPQPEQASEPRTERTAFANRSAVQSDVSLEVARLTGENAELRARLADTQADRDRWHASATAAIERYYHDMQEMRGLLGREQVIALGATAVSAAQEMPQERDTATERGDRTAPVAEPEPYKPVSDTLALGWRRWWRRMTGGS